MITGRACRQEFDYAKTVVKTAEGKVLLKTNEVNNKLLLNIRLMLVKLMEKLGVEKIQPRLPRTDEKHAAVAVEIGEPGITSTVSNGIPVEDVEAK